jgi:hypothetical protein
MSLSRPPNHSNVPQITETASASHFASSIKCPCLVSVLNIKYRRFDAALNMHVAMSVENSVFVQSHPLTRVDVPYLNLALSSVTEEMHLQQHADPKSEPAAARAISSSASRVSPLRSRSELHSHPRFNLAASTATRPNQIISSFARAFKDLQYISSTSDPTWARFTASTR